VGPTMMEGLKDFEKEKPAFIRSKEKTKESKNYN